MIAALTWLALLSALGKKLNIESHISNLHSLPQAIEGSQIKLVSTCLMIQLNIKIIKM